MGAPDDPFGPGPLPPTRKLQTRGGVLEYAVSGEGHPAIVLFNGAGVALEGWRALYPDIERLGTVIAWNRFGIEGSDAPHRVQSGAVVIASVRELLAHAGIDAPYVLVGHSIGGLYANLFARLHPAEVAGVLLIEATHPRDEVLHVDECHIERALQKVQALPPRSFAANLRSELQALGHIVREVDAAGPFPPVPLAVVTGGLPPPKRMLPPEALQARRAHQRELASLSPAGEHVIAQKSGHFPQLSEPQVVLGVLRRLVQRSRAGRVRACAVRSAAGPRTRSR